MNDKPKIDWKDPEQVRAYKRRWQIEHYNPEKQAQANRKYRSNYENYCKVLDRNKVYAKRAAIKKKLLVIKARQNDDKKAILVRGCNVGLTRDISRMKSRGRSIADCVVMLNKPWSVIAPIYEATAVFASLPS